MLHKRNIRLNQSCLDLVVTQSGTGIEGTDIFQSLLHSFDGTSDGLRDFLMLLVLQAAQVLVYNGNRILQNLSRAIAILVVRELRLMNSEGTIVSIPKADLLLPTPTIANRTQFTAESLNTEGNVVQPAFHFGPSTGHEALLGMINNGTTALRRTSMFNAAQQTPGAATLSASSSTTIPPAPNPPPARQSGGSGAIDSVDNRLAQVIQVGNTLWTAQCITTGVTAGIAFGLWAITAVESHVVTDS